MNASIGNVSPFDMLPKESGKTCEVTARPNAAHGTSVQRTLAQSLRAIHGDSSSKRPTKRGSLARERDPEPTPAARGHRLSISATPQSAPACRWTVVFGLARAAGPHAHVETTGTG